MEILFALFAGLLIATALQLLLTNLGIALGLTVLNWEPQRGPAPIAPTEPDHHSERSLPITHLVGAGVALSLSLVLFVASLLMTEFSQIAQPRRGSIFGIILWAAYWLLFAWLSSTTLSSIANSVLGTAIAGGRRLITTLRQAFQSKRPNFSDLEESLLHDLAAEVSRVSDLQQQLPELLKQQRETLIQEISDRTDLSPEQAESVVDELEPSPTDMTGLTSSTMNAGLLSQLNMPSWQQVVRQVLNRVDLSDIDVETLWQQVQSLGDTSHADGQTVAEDNATVVLLDAEEFVRQAPTWTFHPEVLAEEFYERLYDPEADPEQVKAQLSQLDRTHFVNWLEARGDLAAERIEPIADQLNEVQKSILTAIAAPADTAEPLPPTTATEPALANAEVETALAATQEKLLAYCRYTNLDLLTPEGLTEKVHLIRQEQVLPERLSAAIARRLDFAAFNDVLARRQGMTPDRQQALQTALQTAWPQEVNEAASAKQSALVWRKRAAQLVEKTLHSVDWSVVSLEDLKPELLNQLRSLDVSGEPDWAALRSQLQVPEAVQADLEEWLQDAWQQLRQPPRRWAQRVGQSTQSFAQQLSKQITQYLQFQDKTQFQPQQMVKDLAQILQRAVGMLPDWSNLPDLEDLSNLLDLKQLQQVLARRRDLTIEEIQQILSGLESAWQQTTQQLSTVAENLWAEARDLVKTEVSNLDSARQQVVEQVVETQQALQTQAEVMKADLQKQADAARRQVAIAAWWLFLSLLFSGAAAAVAGWLAVQY